MINLTSKVSKKHQNVMTTTPEKTDPKENSQKIR